MPTSTASNLAFPIFMEPNKNYTLEEAYAYCQALAKRHYENFPVASIAIPKSVRPHIAAVYAFARIADDFADEKEFESVRMARLKEWEGLLASLNDEVPVHPVFIALKNTIQQYSLPTQLFFDLLTAFKMDVVIHHYQHYDQLLQYCRYSANPVGRLVLYLMGYPAPKLLEYSDAICTALQLTNFWQDIVVDLEKDRIYLPKEDLKHFRYSEEELRAAVYNSSFQRLMRFEIERTKGLFEKGRPLCEKIPGRFGFELRMTWLGGMTILGKLLQTKGNVFQKRSTLGKFDFLKIALGALKRRAFLES